MPENITALIKKIAEDKGDVYALVLVDGINIGLTLGAIGNKAESAREGA